MKLSDLKFKVITGTPERNRAIQEALFAKGGCWTETGSKTIKRLDAFCLSHNLNTRTPMILNNLSWDDGFSAFEILDAPEVTFQQALDLIAQVEVPEPEFDIKLRDEVLVRDASDGFWEICHFARFEKSNYGLSFKAFSLENFSKIMKYAGNEKYHGTDDTPPKWWEVENGKPVLRRKGE